MLGQNTQQKRVTCEKPWHIDFPDLTNQDSTCDIFANI